MPEEAWHEARLIPTSGINGADEQERRATSALLAVMTSVREFGRALTKPLGAPSGKIATYIEVPFQLGDQRLFPDGLIRVSRGSHTWTCLVEVKTGPNQLAGDQLENYLDIAREQGFDALLTISNEIPAITNHHPTRIDRRKLKKVAIHHLSWSKVLTEAVMQKEFRGVADPDQAWILGELIRYLEHPRSGALEFEDMSDAWVPTREALAAGTLRTTDRGVTEVANRFDALMRFATLRLGRQLGSEVVPVLSRRELAEPSLRTQALVTQLVDQGTMSGSIRIPDAIGDLVVIADLRAGRISCHVDIDAPKHGRATTRVNWLVRQLKSAPDNVRVEAFAARARGAGAAELLKSVREQPQLLAPESTRELRAFRVALSSSMGMKRGRGRGAFVDSVLAAVDAFYESVMQNLKAWSAAPPRMRESEPADLETGVPPALVSTALSSQDGSSPAQDAGPERTVSLLKRDLEGRSRTAGVAD